MIGKTFWCISCKENVSIVASKEQWERYEKGAEKIQDIFPELSADEREILITGMCGRCFDKMFEECAGRG